MNMTVTTNGNANNVISQSTGDNSDTKHVVVLGAGVIGLTTAISILESSSKYNFRVTILASDLSIDPKSIAYTSHWAGAHHVSHATGTGISAPDANCTSTSVEHPEQLSIDQETFRKMWNLSEQGSDSEECFLRIEQVEYYHEEIPVDKDTREEKHHLSWYPNFKILSSSTLQSSPLSLVAQNVRSGVSFNTLTIDPPVYLQYLYERFTKNGGTVVRGRVEDIKDVRRVLREAQSSEPLNSTPQFEIDAIVNCTGLGSLSLRGVQDEALYPLRGQTVLLRAPWVKFGRTISSKGKEGKEDLWTYIIPRRSGNIIVGGTKSPNDTHPTPRPETTLDILRRAVRLCPELLHPMAIKPVTNTGLDTTSPSMTTSIEALDKLSDTDFLNLIEPIIIEAGCGFRPARKGGLRLEAEWIDSTNESVLRSPLVHNYGHSGSGFQSSWGSATRARRLLEEALEGPSK
ncbi:D-amino-acid oxidase [Lentinula aciculospora]|uniref:D-amino-acid oxidase n=1 Tax=Lentinula aciculospora TaxID=153920 RepID=A0A9W9AK97_9AGAR|nr:D-amino-acid oxidase [Lentinula aciculospora]